MSSRPVRRRARSLPVAAFALLALVLGGCGALTVTPPAPTPVDFPGLAAELIPLGVRVERIVSGDAGCDDSTLIPTAIGFDAWGQDQADPVRVHLFVFRNRETWERRRGDVPACASAFVTDPTTFEQIEESPYVAAGQGPWAPDFEAALREGLKRAAGTGG